jgi:DNA-binding NarL/FixJ family response regulator
VFLVDDHPVVREGLSRLIERSDGFAICGEAADGPAALNLIPVVQPDIAVVDLGLREMNGLDLIKTLQLRHPELPILVLSMYDEALYARRALQAGARGYIMKQESIDAVVPPCSGS